ncbi:heavy-metal-associated domain-containing protein [Sulfuriferula thiophila]|uniref:heavy-metal-associated domain-containing protein n=1 Tax=Sulfuriferula thiophila TaxID=1781211 RepID=UPI000F604815|nr:heavy metal-associated domain-containing protein [Sulfuriferula thiophila]
MQHIVLNITGMTCGGCTNSVKRVLSALPGIGEVNVSLEHANAEVEFDPAVVNIEALKQAIEAAGFEVAS